MKNIPKELTAELLGLVLGREKVLKVKSISHGSLNYVIEFDDDELELDENLDTLARLMKEWCIETTGADYHCGLSNRHIHYFEIDKYNSGNIKISRQYGDTELEAIAKVIHYIAKQKGLLC